MTEPASPAGWTAGTVTPLPPLNDIARLRLDLRDAEKMRVWYATRAVRAEEQLDALVRRVVRLRKLLRHRWTAALVCGGFIPGFTLGYGLPDLLEWFR